MTIQEIQRLVSAQRFEPFRVMVADGNTYDVRHRENLAFGGKGRQIAIALPDDSFVTLDLLSIKDIRKPIPRAAKNGVRNVFVR